jgi:hypothetical protein
MLKRAVYPVTIVVVFSVAGFLIFFRPTDQKRVASLVSEQVSLFNSGDVRGLYDTLSPRARQVCSLTSFTQLFDRGRQALDSYGGDPQVSASGVDVSVDGTTAQVELALGVGPVRLFSATSADPLTYSKVSGTWYLDGAGPLDVSCTA